MIFEAKSSIGNSTIIRQVLNLQFRGNMFRERILEKTSLVAKFESVAYLLARTTFGVDGQGANSEAILN